MTKEKADKALVNALRKHGISTIAKAAKLLVGAHRSRTPADVGAMALALVVELLSTLFLAASRRTVRFNVLVS